MPAHTQCADGVVRSIERREFSCTYQDDAKEFGAYIP